MTPLLPLDLQADAGWRAAWTIITSGTFHRGDARLWPHVDLQHRSLYFERILADHTWSETEYLMLQIAGSLYDFDLPGVSLYRLCDRLDDCQFATVLAALRAFRRQPGGLRVRNKGNGTGVTASRRGLVCHPWPPEYGPGE